MTDSILRRDIESALGSTYEIVRELPQAAGLTAYSARSHVDESHVVVSAIRASALTGNSIHSRLPAGGPALDHPNILPILASASHGETFLWVSPEVEGRTLRSRLARGGRVAPEDSMILLRDISAALTHAHRHGVVHGGLSPDNVLISGGSALVTNLGIAPVFAALNRDDKAMTSSSTAEESYRYSSPEQVAGAAADARSDVYAWGVMAYELLGGRHPFAGRYTAREMVAAHTSEEPPQLMGGRSGVAPAVTRLVMKCLSKEKAKRPQAAGEVLDLMTREMLTPPPAPPAGAGQKLTIAVVVALAAALTALMLFGTTA